MGLGFSKKQAKEKSHTAREWQNDLQDVNQSETAAEPFPDPTFFSAETLDCESSIVFFPPENSTDHAD